MGIPKQIFQICIGFDNTKHYLFLNKVEHFIELNPHYEYNMITSFAQLDEFVKTHCSEEIRSAYKKIKESDAKVEFCKYLILHEYGGVFIDKDADFTNIDLDSVLERDDGGIVIRSERVNEYSNAFMAFSANHSILERTIKLIMKYISKEAFSDISSSVYSKAVKIEHFNVYNKNVFWNSVKSDDVLSFENRDSTYRLFGNWLAFINSWK
jgi:mannosyltransferase OCH1-like enzyme